MSPAENRSADPSASFGDDIDALLEARATVEQAKGILMERYAMSGDAAFSVLRRLSQNTNRKLREIAHDLVETGELPTDPTEVQSGHSAGSVRPPPLAA